MTRILVIGSESEIVEPTLIAARDEQMKVFLASSIEEATARGAWQEPAIALVSTSAMHDDVAGALARLRAAPTLSRAMVVVAGPVGDLSRAVDACDECVATPMHVAVLRTRLRGLARMHRGLVQIDALRAKVAELEARAPVIPVRDERSGAYDRRYLELRLPEEVERTRRYGQPLSVIRIAIDDLRGIAVAHGRGVAEEALQATATTLQQAVRKVDFVARHRAADFVVVAPSTDEAGARVLAARLGSTVRALFAHRPLGATRFRPVVRVGTATMHGRDGAAAPTAPQLLEMTDAASREPHASAQP